jgi:hypothetical protein
VLGLCWAEAGWMMGIKLVRLAEWAFTELASKPANWSLGRPDGRQENPLRRITDLIIARNSFSIISWLTPFTLTQFQSPLSHLQVSFLLSSDNSS